MSSRKQIDDQITRDEQIFYTNKLDDEDELDEDIQPLRNSIVEDQFDRFKKRNHYLRKTTVTIDSRYRNRTQTTQTEEISYDKLAMMISRKAPTKLFFYIPINSVSNNDNIYFVNMTSIITRINDIPSNILEFDKIRKVPTFYTINVSNSEMLNYFDWTFLDTFLSYDNEGAFVVDPNPNFFYITYSENASLLANDWLYIDDNQTLEIYKITNKTVAYPTTSYYKIFLSRTLTNIYKLKILDIKLPKTIFNVNNQEYSANGYSFRVNGKVRFILKNNSFVVNNLGFVGQRIRYNLFNKEALYDPSGYQLAKYTYVSDNYPNIFIGTNIYEALIHTLDNISSNNQFQYFTEENIFEIAYFFLIQYNMYYKGLNKLEYFSLDSNGNPEEIYYLYTVDIIRDYFSGKNNSIMLKPKDILNNKMPEIYFNDYILYANNETYKIPMKAFNELDLIYYNKFIKSTAETKFFPECYTVLEDYSPVLIGKVVDYNVPYFTSKGSPAIYQRILNTLILNYNFGITPKMPNFNPTSILGTTLYGLSSWSSSSFYPNNCLKYVGFDSTSSNFYYDVSYNAYINFSTYMYQYNYLLWRQLNQTVVSSGTKMLTNTSYILALDTDISGIYTDGLVLYSLLNGVYKPNTLVNYLGLVGGKYYYIVYNYSNSIFSINDQLYILSGGTYTSVATVNAIFKLYQIIKFSSSQSVGVEIYNGNRQGIILKSLGSNTYIVALNYIESDNYLDNYFYNELEVFNSSGTKLSDVSEAYQFIGTVEDIVVTIGVDARLYLSSEYNYDVVAKTMLVPNQQAVIPVDNIRIIETKTETKYEVIEYSGKQIEFDNGSTSFSGVIKEQPIYDRQLDIFVFKVSIREAFNLTQIYTLQNYRVSVEGTTIGTAYSICYNPIRYANVIQKSDGFQMEYLQNWGKYIYTSKREIPYNFSSGKPNRNYVIENPTLTNASNLQSYELYPKYEIQIDNGHYTNEEFANALETKMNEVEYQQYNYFKKTLEYFDATNQVLNDASFRENKFKVSYNNTTSQIDIGCYSILNRRYYTAYYDPITPYLYFKIDNNNIENNNRVFVEVVKDVEQSSLSSTVAEKLNTTFTSRILPIFNYEIRTIIPSINNIEQIKPEVRNDVQSIQSLLTKISLQPFNFRKNYPNMTSSLSNAGQMLYNIYNNTNSYVGDGRTVNNIGINNPFSEDEVVIIITNIYHSYEPYKIGRMVNIHDKTSNKGGNYNVDIQMIGDNKVSFPFFIGDIIYGMNSGAIAMIVPYEWGMFPEVPELARIHATLPSNDIIRLGNKNYLKLLFKYTGKQYLLDMINDYNMVHYSQYNLFNQTTDDFNAGGYDPFLNWPIQEVKNSFRGFEIFFEYPVKFTLNQDQLILNFMEEQEYCLFLGKNQNGVYDTPTQILDFETDQIINYADYVNNEQPIPWSNSFNNTTKIDRTGIIKMYFTYGSDNILQNRMFAEVSNVDNYAIGDKLRLKDVAIKPVYQRTAFNIYNTTNHNIKMIISFDMYLSFIVYRTVLIKLGIPNPLGPNDFLRLENKNITDMTYLVNSLYYGQPATTYSQIVAYSDFIIENYGSVIQLNDINDSDPALTRTLEMMGNIPIVSKVSSQIATVISQVVLNLILPWFVDYNNLLLWTKGDRKTLTYIQENYIDLTGKNIIRLELEILDDFIFKSGIVAFDSSGVVIGTTAHHNQYSDYLPVNNSKYVVYINVATGYDPMTITIGDYITVFDGAVKNRVISDPISVTEDNKHIYLYDTYLKFKVIAQMVSNNNDTYGFTQNFSQVDNIQSVFLNLFNMENQNIDSYKNGYYVSIARNEAYWDLNDNTINGTYRTMINMIDNKNLLRIFSDLGIITNFDNIKANIINKQGVSKDIGQIQRYMDVCQLLVDLSPTNTIMIDLDMNTHIEEQMFSAFKYQLRRVDNVFSICGNLNFTLQTLGYQPKFIYGSSDNPTATVVPYLNNIFKSIYSDTVMNTAKKNGTIDTTMCSMSDIYSKSSGFNTYLTVFNQPNNFCYGLLWVDITSGDDEIYLVFNAAQTNNNAISNLDKGIYVANRNNLDNYCLLINFIYIDNQKSYDVANIERNEIIQNNVIQTITPVTQSIETTFANRITNYTYNSSTNTTTTNATYPYRIFKIKTKYPVKYNVLRGTPILIKDYYTTLYKEPNSKIKDQNTVYLEKNWLNELNFNIESGQVIRFNYSSYNNIYKSYIGNSNNFDQSLFSFSNDDILHEETNIISSIGGTVSVNGKEYITIVLINPIRYEYQSEMPVIINFTPMNLCGFTSVSGAIPALNETPFENTDNTIQNMNDILTTCLSTQNVIVNGEWYTKIYYQGEKNIDLFEINKGGINSFNNKTTQKVNISGMRGIVSPNTGFGDIERNYLDSTGVSFDQYQKNNYIKPVPDGVYDLVHISKEDGQDFLSEHVYDLPVGGYFKDIYTTNTPEQDPEWIDNAANYKWFYAYEESDQDLTSLRNTRIYQNPGLKFGITAVPGNGGTTYVLPNLATPVVNVYRVTLFNLILGITVDATFSYNQSTQTLTIISPPFPLGPIPPVIITAYYNYTDPNAVVNMNKIGFITKTEASSPLTTHNGKKVYKVYVRLDTTNVSSLLFLSGKSSSLQKTEQGFEITFVNKLKTLSIAPIFYLFNEFYNPQYSQSLQKNTFHSITIKGRYSGFGGTISLENKNNIVNSIEYTVSDIDTSRNIIELDMENNQDIYSTFFRFNSYGEGGRINEIYQRNYNHDSMYVSQINPFASKFQQIPMQYLSTNFTGNELINYYDIYPSRYGFIADSGTMYKTTIEKPYSTEITDFIYVCFKNIDSNVVVEQNNPIGEKVIFVKVYVNKNFNNLDVDYTNYEVIYDQQLLNKLSEVEIFFLDKAGNLINFHNLDNNLQLEVQEYVERIKTINTKNAMVF